MVDIKEALAALAFLESAAIDSPGPLGPRPPTLHINRQLLAQQLEPIRTALQSVAQEREDWAAVQKWRQLADANSWANGVTSEDGYYFDLWVGEALVSQNFGGTRAEALSKAAAWARAETAK